jgi:hypothetical protein
MHHYPHYLLAVCIISDWLPTLMSVATAGTWSGSYDPGVKIDGVDMWQAITQNVVPSPRKEIVLYYYLNDYVYQNSMKKVMSLSNTKTLPRFSTPINVLVAEDGSEPASTCEAETSSPQQSPTIHPTAAGTIVGTASTSAPISTVLTVNPSLAVITGHPTRNSIRKRPTLRPV